MATHYRSSAPLSQYGGDGSEDCRVLVVAVVCAILLFAGVCSFVCTGVLGKVWVVALVSSPRSMQKYKKNNIVT